MRKCEMCGRETEGNWAPFYGLKQEHGKLCKPCAEEISEGKQEKAAVVKKDLSEFDAPVYPPDDLPKDLAKIAAAFVNKLVTQGQDGPVIGQVTEAHIEGDLVIGTLEVNQCS